MASNPAPAPAPHDATNLARPPRAPSSSTDVDQLASLLLATRRELKAAKAALSKERDARKAAEKGRRELTKRYKALLRVISEGAGRYTFTPESDLTKFDGVHLHGNGGRAALKSGRDAPFSLTDHRGRAHLDYTRAVEAGIPAPFRTPPAPADSEADLAEFGI